MEVGKTRSPGGSDEDKLKELKILLIMLARLRGLHIFCPSPQPGF